MQLSWRTGSTQQREAARQEAFPCAQVFVKILEVAEDGGGRVRVGASIKVVDQESGADLDPGNLATARSAQMSHCAACRNEVIVPFCGTRAVVPACSSPYGTFLPGAFMATAVLSM